MIRNTIFPKGVIMIFTKQDILENYFGDCVVGYKLILIQGVLLWEN